MEIRNTGARAFATLLLLLVITPDVGASHDHNDHHLHLLKDRQIDLWNHTSRLTPRGGGGGGLCSFPTDPDLVAVTPGMTNGGWAMSPDMPCKPGMYCPYACAPGKVMTQWQPGSVYTFPQSTRGGLYCDESGEVSKPFPDKPYCVEGTGAVLAVNELGEDLSFCQTALPGYENMVIPTLVGAGSSAVLAVPDTSYWCETAAHYYINAPGVGTDGCIWGSKTSAIGNWTPFVAGANTDATGQTFVKAAWNPVWMEEASLMANLPTWGIRITCDDDAGCNGLPCEINPAKGGINSVQSSESAVGAGGGDFCVVTVPRGQTAKIVVFDGSGGGSGGGSSGSGSSSGDDDDGSSSYPIPTQTLSPPGHEEATPILTAIAIALATVLDAAGHAGHASSAAAHSSSTPTSEEVPTSTVPATTPSAVVPPTSSTKTPVGPGRPKTPIKLPRPSHPGNLAVPTVAPAIFHQNSSSSAPSSEDDMGSYEGGSSAASISAVGRPSADSPETSDASSPQASPSNVPTGEGHGRQPSGSAVAGLLVALVAMAYLY